MSKADVPTLLREGTIQVVLMDIEDAPLSAPLPVAVYYWPAVPAVGDKVSARGGIWEVMARNWGPVVSDATSKILPHRCIVELQCQKLTA